MYGSLKKMLSLLLVSLLALSVLAGCGASGTGNAPASSQVTDQAGSTAPATTTAAKPSGEKVSLRFATAMDADRLKYYQTSVDGFNNQHGSDINVTIENTPWTEYWQKLKAQTASGTMPDVWNDVPGFGQEWLEKGLLLPLDDYIAKDPEVKVEDFIPSMLDLMTKDGKLYGFPYDVSALYLYYNKDLFTKAGVEIPNDNWTWDDAKQAAKDIMSKVPKLNGAKVYGFGSRPLPGTDWTAIGFLKSFGGEFVTKDLEVKIDSPESIAAYKYFIDMGAVDKLFPSSTDDCTTAWLNGRAAMALEGPWSIPTFIGSCKFEWDIVKAPSGPKGNKMSLLGGTFVINKATKYPDQSFTFLKYLTGTEQLAEIIAKPGAGIPGRISSGASMSPMMQKAAKIINDNTEGFYPFQGMFGIFETQQKEMQLGWDGKKSAEDIAKAIADAARKVIKDNYGK